MTAALSWINDLAQWLGRWVPRLTPIEPTHRAIRFGLKGSATELGPGPVLHWPIIHTLVRVPITTQSVQLSAQVLPHPANDPTSLVPRVLLCGIAVQFRVDRAVEMATKVLHVHALVDNRAQAAIARHLDLHGDLQAWAAAASRDLSGELRPFGVVVERLDFTQFGMGVALKNVADWNYADRAGGTRPVDAE
jgi:hypothetical protein